jgi:hypothetical protein
MPILTKVVFHITTLLLLFNRLDHSSILMIFTAVNFYLLFTVGKFKALSKKLIDLAIYLVVNLV